jgi:hypothetical protein
MYVVVVVVAAAAILFIHLFFIHIVVYATLDLSNYVLQNLQYM